MKKNLLAIALLAACPIVSFAQEREPLQLAPKVKKVNHQIGVQMNELVKQVFNFNNSSVSINNPYLLTYSLNFSSGWGIRTGVGYNLRTIIDDNGINKVETKINTLNARLGFEKAFKLSNKWSAGAGLDLLYSDDKNNTVSTTISFDTVTTKTDRSRSSYGAGPMAWLRYNISDHVLIGTETSFYYRTGKEKLDVTITSREDLPFGAPETKTSKTDNDISEGIFALPVALYLIVKF